jgi:N-acetylglutamate synthase-like GNAT family acetyltransferase
MTPAAALATVTPRPRPVAGQDVFLRSATADDAGAIHALIAAHLAEGHLLPRERGEIAVHAHRFVVACQDDRVVACAELAPLSRDVSEVRSLVVSQEARSLGLGGELIDELGTRATVAGFEKLCAFTHAPSYFVQLGFSMVPHVWLPEKIVTDCHSCPHFRRCGQYAVQRELRRANQAFVPLAALHG